MSDVRHGKPPVKMSDVRHGLVMGWLDSCYRELRASAGRRPRLKNALKGGAVLLFGRSGLSGEFELLEAHGYGKSEPYYSFLESPELLDRIVSSGPVLLDDAYSLLGDCRVWAMAEPRDNPKFLMVAEVPSEVEFPEYLLYTLFLLYVYGGARRSSIESAEREDLPIWLENYPEKVAKMASPLLLSGLPGSGQIELARAVAQESGSPYAVFTPGGLSEAVQLRELFGDPASKRLGSAGSSVPMMERDISTIIINEAGNLASMAQLRLLSYFSSGKTSELRWIFTSSRDLKKIASEGGFEPGLYSRLAGSTCQLPGLADCQDWIRMEISRLGDNFCLKQGRSVEMPEDVVDFLVRRDWPENWSGLRSSLESALMLSSDGTLRESDFLALSGDLSGDPGDLNLRRKSAELERSLLLKAYALHGGNQVHMARALGISRGSLQYKMEKYGLHSSRQDV